MVQEVKATPVVLVQATTSAPNEAERNYAAKITARLAEWLQSVGLPVLIVTDDQVSTTLCDRSKVVVLPSNANPGPHELAILRRFLGNGGKLLVFYAANPDLASMMGFKLGPFTTSSGFDCWKAFRFSSEAPAGVPGRVDQESRNLRPVFPDRPDARIMAWWESAGRNATRHPAWVSSRHGFWMSHILLESDVAAKKQLLVSLLHACDSQLGQVAAAHAVNHVGTLGLYASAAQTVNAIAAQAGQSPQRARVESLLAQAGQLQNELIENYRNGRYLETLAQARNLDSTLTEAFACTQSAREGEFRGVWNHSGTGFTPGKWDESCALLKHSGMTAILPNVQRPWCAHYPSRLIPASETLTRYGDQMADCLSAATRHGLETHAWVILWSLEGAPDGLIRDYRQAGRLQVAANGSPISWLCPSHPDNRAFERTALRDLVSRYPELDGVQLDYIRYKSADTCYCNGCRARFTKDTGIRITRWPAEVRSGSKAPAYRQWRRDQITRFVAEVRREISALNPRIKLSASVYAGYPGCADSIAQDWAEWVRRGLVDFVCPMNYTADPAKFAEWVHKQTAYPGVKGKLYAGIGVTSLECRLNAAETIRQINLLRRDGETGFTLFEANPTLKDDILPYLKMGTTAL